MKRGRVFVWETAGFFLIVLSGSLLHFVFDLSGGWPPLAVIAAVNESVWEHLKLAFWPAFLYALIEWPFFRARTKDFWAAKTAGIFAMPVVIVSLFYGYTALAGRNILLVDISLFILAVFVGQIISSRLLLRRSFAPLVKVAAIVLLISMIAAFSLLTFFPPKYPLFRDSRTGQYGILR